MTNNFTEKEILRIEELLKAKDELYLFSLNEEPFYDENCIVLVYNMEKAKIPVIVSREEEKARQIAEIIAEKYSTANEVFVAIPVCDNGEITNVDIKHIPFEFPKYEKEQKNNISN